MSGEPGAGGPFSPEAASLAGSPLRSSPQHVCFLGTQAAGGPASGSLVDRLTSQPAWALWAPSPASPVTVAGAGPRPGTLRPLVFRSLSPGSAESTGLRNWAIRWPYTLQPLVFLTLRPVTAFPMGKGQPGLLEAGPQRR